MAENLQDMISAFESAEDQELYEQNKKKPKLKLEDFIIKKAGDLPRYDIIDPTTNNVIGNFPYYPARIKDVDVMGANEFPGGFSHAHKAEIPGHITMDYPVLDSEYRGRGIGSQMYKKIEELTGKKIMPDVNLSESSLPLHQSSGLGKHFGSSEYGPAIKEAVAKKVAQLQEMGELAKKLSPKEAGEQAFQNMKNQLERKGLKGFKSLALPALTGGAGLLLSGASEAADSPEAGDSLGQDALERDIAADKQQKRIEKSSSVPDEVKLKALELFKKNRLPY